MLFATTPVAAVALEDGAAALKRRQDPRLRGALRWPAGLYSAGQLKRMMVFYAGSRALLVSHWPVESQSATELTRGMFETLKANPTMGRSEALRRSMFRLAANDNHPHWAHPAFWAPFVVVGEGARR